MQILDRLYFRVAPARIRVPQKPDSYDFSHLTKKEYLENPELFYSKPDRIPDFSTTRVTDIDGVEIVDVKFLSPVQTKHAKNNTVHGLYFNASGKKGFCNGNPSPRMGEK